MKKRVIIKGIISYLAAIFFAVIFGLFLDANVGWFILITLILAPVISVYFAWISAKMLSVSCEMEDVLLSKGDTCSMVVNVRNHSIFPTPPLAVTLTNEPGVRSENGNLLVSVLPRATQTFEVQFKAKISGKSTVGIESVKVTDYLGLFSFSAKRIDKNAMKRTVAVIPEIAEISAKDDNILKVMQTSLHMDDGDDTMESASYAFGGFPGYDNRDYVPGDPIKRINWKQSAKRNRLLVRLDDEMASKSVNVVLDSVFKKNLVNIHAVGLLQQYRDCVSDEIIPKIGEDAVENALGIIQVLLRHQYTVNFYVMQEKEFCGFEIADESDLEAIRLELASYSFREEGTIERIPRGDLNFKEKVGVFSTPNRYEEAYGALESEAATLYTTIYSVVEEAAKQNTDDSVIQLKDFNEIQEEKVSIGKKVAEAIKSLAVPYLLALLLSMAIFSVFEVPVLSVWSLGQAVMCAGIMVFCEYVKKHRVLGTFLTIVLVMGILNVAARLAFSQNGLLAYMYWFLSGGESIETTASYLMTLILIFTVFFSMVVYYFSNVLYRTSFLLLVSLIPFLIHVKVMQEINMVQVVFITALNIVAFMLNTRKQQDQGKRVIGRFSSMVSLGLYGVIFIMIGLAVPEAETRYYYLFENLFLGGNVSVELPEEYSEMSDYSGNADGFNELNNRKLYVIRDVDTNSLLYLRRQTFDLYDFEYDRWYPLEEYTEPVYSQNQWEQAQRNKNLSLLIQALQCADEHVSGLLSEYGLPERTTGSIVITENIRIETTNFPSVAYITPLNTVKITSEESVAASQMGVFQSEEGFLSADLQYAVEFYDEYAVQNSWISVGGANFDQATAMELLELAEYILDAKGETEYAEVVALYIEEAKMAEAYRRVCEENTELIPESVKNLALEITEGCTYDWQKAVALQNYFKTNGFIYDLSYDAPDDSVEYFLFEGKTGTCSDFASAYVLMARSVGLIVRYVEGFVPEMEYNGEYVVRTSCGHAYPEVYIPNVGFVVYEATQPAGYGESGGHGSGIMAYFVAVGVRVLAVFAFVSTLILAVLFIHLIAAPYLREAYFFAKLKKEMPGRTVVMLYKRIQEKYAKDFIKKSGTLTPYEFAQKFEEELEYDISELSYMVERTAYTQESIGVEEQERAKAIYQSVKKVMKEKVKKRENIDRKGRGREKRKAVGK